MRLNRWSAASPIVALLIVAGCAGGTAEAALEPPAKVEEVGDGLHRLTLTARAVKRLGVETAPVATRVGELTVPYSAVFYTADGQAWVYTSSQDRVYVRAPIEVDEIDAKRGVAILASGPPVSTMVVTVGVAELFGTETGVGGSGH